MKELFVKMYAGIVSGFRRLFGGKLAERALRAGQLLADLLPYALPAVMAVAEMTRNRSVDEIRRLFASLGQDPGVDLDRPLTELQVNALLTAAARFAARRELEKAIEAAGGAGLLLGSSYVKRATVIPDRVIDTAVQNAYLLLRNVVELPEN